MIPEKYTYLFVNFISIIFPFIFSFTTRFDFISHWKSFVKASSTIAIFYIVWDIAFTQMKVWGFHHEYTIGRSIMGLPIEEILFFFCIPFACLFTYYCFKKFVFPKIPFHFNIGWLLIGLLFLIIAIFNYSKLYTFSAFLSAAIACMMAYKYKLLSFLHFLVFYTIILLPFFLINGILTGSFLDRIVVFYNNSENLNMRMFTIPVEDTFYGLGLLLFNILCFEFFNQKSIIKNH